MVLIVLTGTLLYLLTRQVNNKAEYQYIECKLSSLETNLCLVKYLLKGIG